MESLTLQALLNEAWVDIAEISFPESDNGNWRLTELDYLSDYAIEHLDADNHCAASINHPVALYFDDHGSPGWLRFIDDIIPSGASRRYWVNQLDLDGLTPQQQDFILLKYGTISPVGNLRIKESLPDYQPEAESDLVPAPELLSALRETAASLVELPERLRERGVPEAILMMPSIGFKFMTDKLTRWGLL